MRKRLRSLLLSPVVGLLPWLAQTPEPPKPAGDFKFFVAASKVWTDTGLDLDPGDRVSVRGGVLSCGGPTPSEKAHLPMPSAPGGALLLKLHGEAKPILASPDADVPIVDAGHLYLGVNGWDCRGKISARVHVERRPEAEKKTK